MGNIPLREEYSGVRSRTSNPWVTSPIPDTAEIKGKQALASACFYSGGRI